MVLHFGSPMGNVNSPRMILPALYKKCSLNHSQLAGITIICVFGNDFAAETVSFGEILETPSPTSREEGEWGNKGGVKGRPFILSSICDRPHQLLIRFFRKACS